MTTFRLVVMMTGNPNVLSEHAFEKAPVSIGRATGNDVVLPDVEKRVSSRHARIERSAGAFQVVDLGSTNGTFLNDRRLEPNSGTLLKDGDRISIGLYQLRFHGAEEIADQTIVVVDPARYTAELAEELPVLYARHASDAPERRREVLKEALRRTLEAVGPPNARAVLAQLRGRFQAGEARLLSEPTTEVRRKDVEIQQQESLYQAGTKVLSELSARFVGEAKFETAEQMELFGKLVAQSLELTFEWISKSLKGRKEFEEQFSADLSMIFSKEKNPLKSGGGPADMGRYLLDWKAARPLAAVRDSLDGAFKDLTMHQLGLLAGLQESLGAVLKRLDPKSVENEAKEKGGGMFASVEKRAWKRYEEIFAEIFAENSRLFNEMIYPNVRKGYLATHQDEESGKAGPASGRDAAAPRGGTEK
jgi:type VI secretion system FHA domain protein